MKDYEFARKLASWLRENIVNEAQIMEPWDMSDEGDEEDIDLSREAEECRVGIIRDSVRYPLALPDQRMERGLSVSESGKAYQMNLKLDLEELYEEYIELGWGGMMKKTRKILRTFGLLKEKTTSGFRSALPPDRRKLFDELCGMRKECARKRAVPPYVVFSNKALYGMALRLPVSEEEMMDISGVGERNYSLYGEQFLEMLKTAADNCSKNYRQLHEIKNMKLTTKTV